MKVDVVSQVVIDRTEDADFRVNFNVTFPDVSCEWLSVDVYDVIGHKKTNLTDTTIHKYNLAGGYVGPAIKSWHQPRIGQSTEVEQYAEKRYTIPLTTVNFGRVVKEYKVRLAWRCVAPSGARSRARLTATAPPPPPLPYR